MIIMLVINRCFLYTLFTDEIIQVVLKRYEYLSLILHHVNDYYAHVEG